MYLDLKMLDTGKQDKNIACRVKVTRFTSILAYMPWAEVEILDLTFQSYKAILAHISKWCNCLMVCTSIVSALM